MPGWAYEPLVVEDEVIVSCGDKHLYAYGRDGALHWKAPVGFSTHRPALSPDGSTLYAATYDNELVAYDRRGRELWRFSHGWGGLGEPAVGPDGTIYVGSHARALLAVTPDGEEKWRLDTPAGVAARPVVDGRNNRVFVGDLTGVLLGVDAASGKEMWRRETHEAFRGAVALDGGGKVLMSRWKSLAALNPETGETVWESPASPAREAGPTVAPDGRIFLSTTDDGLACYSPTGERLWNVDIDTALVTTPLLAENGTLVARDFERNLWAFDQRGSVLWFQETFNPDRATVISEPAVAPDGTVYSGNQDSTVTAYRGLTLEEYLARLERGSRGHIDQQEDWIIVGDVAVPTRM